MATYVAGTRRLSEMITEARKLAYQENYSYTEGWDDNAMVEIFNLAMDRLYGGLTEVDNPDLIKQTEIDVVAAQQAYDIPIDVLHSIRIPDVRFYFGGGSYEYTSLRQIDIQDRLSTPVNIPNFFTIRNRQILLSPTPNVSRAAALVINYQKMLRKLDIRRGKVTSYTEDGSGLNMVFTLNFTVVSEKDTNMQADANSVLDRVDYCCLVDRSGSSIVDAIPLQGYDTTSLELTAEPTYDMPAAEQTALDAAIAAGTTVYVVQGDYSSTHSELGRQTEDYLIEYAILRLLRLQSAAEPTKDQRQTEEEVLRRFVWAYRRVKPAIRKIRFENTYRSGGYGGFGGFGTY